MGWLEDVYNPAIFQKAPEYFPTLTHFKWFCSSGNVISRCMRTGECHLCSRTRTCIWRCGHPKHGEQLGLQSKHKDTVAIPTQDQIISESIRPCPNTTIFITKRWKRERRFCYESECAILPFYPVFWSGCYQSGTPGGKFGLLPRALAGTDTFPLWKGNWNLKMSCNMHSLDVFQWTLTCYKEKKWNCTWCVLQV